MKIGDLVRCAWQPKSSVYVKGVGCIPMKHTIKGEVGIYTKHRCDASGIVLFPQLGYEHTLAWSTLEVINEE
jgi:hypothetical protein